MWADTLLAAERAHLLRLALWAAVSVLGGTLLLGLEWRRVPRAPLRVQFAVQTAAWGLANLLIVWFARAGLELRDFAGARRLERFLWFNTGLDVGYVAVGITLALAGWVLGRRLGAVGAGMAVVVQGLALLVLDLVLAGRLVGMT
ncbi:MAG: hypothetical protein HY275_12440 [Gemmatimonadetes bacterium]|nr:hypothetical protein [Gemmatimonadota bacterium]